MSSFSSLSGDVTNGEDHLTVFLAEDEPLVVSPPYPPAAPTTHKLTVKPDVVRIPVNVEGWPQGHDRTSGGVSNVQRQMGSEDRCGAFSHASTVQKMGGQDN